MRRGISYRISTLLLLARQNAKVFLCFFVILCAAMVFLQVNGSIFSGVTAHSEIPYTQADFFVRASGFKLFALCYTPLIVIFMLYCCRNDYLTNRIIRYRHATSIWFLQVAKALLMALGFALVLTALGFVMSLFMAEEGINFDSVYSYFAYSTRGETIPNPPLAYLIFLFFLYAALTLFLVNLIWLVLDALFSKKWVALVISFALGVLSAASSSITSVAIPLPCTLATIWYTSWLPGASHGFVYLWAAVAVMIVAGFLLFRIRGVPLLKGRGL